MEKKFREFISEFNEMCTLAKFIKIEHLFHKCIPPNDIITIDINGEVEIPILLQSLTRLMGSKLAKYFQKDPETMKILPITEEIPSKKYFIGRKTVLTIAVFDFIKSPNYCLDSSFIHKNTLKAELLKYGILDQKHYKIFKYKKNGKICFEWNTEYL